jgi:hypothetical protein
MIVKGELFDGEPTGGRKEKGNGGGEMNITGLHYK